MRWFRIAKGVRRGFTLLEIFAVIAIIGVLSTLVISASLVVSKRQQVNATRNIIFKLDQALEEYIAQRNIVPAYLLDAYTVHAADPGSVTVTYKGEQFPFEPDSSVFILAVQGVGECDALLAGLPPSRLVRTDPDAPAPSVIDGWGDFPNEPEGYVLYVHPDNLLAQAFYGRCINRRPYFVSAGPDGLFGRPDELELIREEDLGPDPNDPDARMEALNKMRSDNVYSYDGIVTSFNMDSEAFGLTSLP